MKLVETKDHSQTLYSPEFDQTYHSIHGAMTESLHVFIDNGLMPYIVSQTRPISIFEMGYGTGLNAVLTWQVAKQYERDIEYISIEKFPIDSSILHSYRLPNNDLQKDFDILTDIDWGQNEKLDFFNIKKIISDLAEYNSEERFDIIYFDAFSPNAQPELWTVEIFTKMYHLLRPQGRLTTYCAKGDVKRNLKAAGFTVLAVPGPPGKREITIAHKDK